MSSRPSASIVIPTRNRPGYLRDALASITPQAQRAGAEVIVIDDGEGPAAAAVAGQQGARLVPARRPGANAARNAGLAAAQADLVIFCDDDVRAPAGWLDALLAGAAAHPGHDVFGGPIRAELEGGGPRGCGREPAPITTLDLGAEDQDANLVWSANMAIRRRALERVGGFDETIQGRGEEEDWERRYTAQGGRIRYLARAALVHRRCGRDARLPALARAAYGLGRSARRYDQRQGAAPSRAAELRTVAGCAWHVFRRRCLIGVVLGAHAAGRWRESFAPAPGPAAPDDFMSGTHGQVIGIRATTRALAADALADAALAAGRVSWRLRRAGARSPRRRVLVLAIEREDTPNVLAAARAELLASHHEVDLVVGTAGGRGRFENLNALLAAHPAAGHDWLLVIDDDVVLPSGFLDAFLFLSERFDLRLAQPAHRHRSHAAFQITRRRIASVVRETAFVEIGPVTAFHADTFSTLLPFPELRVGWGLDAHWSAVAAARGWPIGVVDATPIRHGLRRIASSYDRDAAVAEARAFLAGRSYTPAAQAQRTLRAHRRWR